MSAYCSHCKPKKKCCDQVVVVRGPVGPQGSQGPVGATCEIINFVGPTSVSVCEPNIIRGLANDYLLVTDPASDPFDPANVAGENLLLATVNGIDGPQGPPGALRVGNFRETDLANIGDYSSVFGYHTQASGVGALAHGINTEGTILAQGDGSHAFGRTDDGTILTEDLAYGSVANGYANGGGQVRVKSDTYGTIVSANAIGSTVEAGADGSIATAAAFNSTVRIGDLGGGNALHAYASNSTITLGNTGVGNALNAYASNSTITLGDRGLGNTLHVASSSAGSVGAGDDSRGVLLHGYAQNTCEITIGNRNVGTQVHGASVNISSIPAPPSRILTENDTRAGYLGGYASNGGIAKIGNPAGDIVSRAPFLHGTAETENEVHEVVTDGSFSFGRNNSVAPFPGIDGTPIYSGAMGRNAITHMNGSFAHSSFASGSIKGARQYVRLLTQTTSDQDWYFITGDNQRLSLPYVGNGRAIVQVSIIGDTDACAKVVFSVTKTGAVYTTGSVTILHNEGFMPANITADGGATFTLRAKPELDQPLCATFKITMIAEPAPVI